MAFHDRLIPGFCGAFPDLCAPPTGGGNGPPFVPFPEGIVPGSPPPAPNCGAGFFWDVVRGECRRFPDTPGDVPFDPVPGEIPSPAETGGTTSVHGMNGHADTIPKQVEIRRRVCPPGSVLGKRGWCHDKIANKDRMYPKPRRALGTAGDLNAVTKAKAFSKRLLGNQKSLKQTAANFAKASQFYRNKPGK